MSGTGIFNVTDSLDMWKEPEKRKIKFENRSVLDFRCQF